MYMSKWPQPEINLLQLHFIDAPAVTEFATASRHIHHVHVCLSKQCLLKLLEKWFYIMQRHSDSCSQWCSCKTDVAPAFNIGQMFAITVKPLLKDHYYHARPVSKEFLAKVTHFNANESITKNHLSWETIFLWLMGWSFKTISTVLSDQKTSTISNYQWLWYLVVCFCFVNGVSRDGIHYIEWVNLMSICIDDRTWHHMSNLSSFLDIHLRHFRWTLHQH